MVFQNYALYPHMTVRENMGFALKLAKIAEGRDRQARSSEAAEILELEQHLDRKPANLSGGQRQRVAMGRAIVRDPKAFLMDEPLSNLDAKLRVQMRTEVARIQHQLGTTMVYVTHDQTEAMTLGDRVAVMRAGIIQQVDTPKVLYEDPLNLFVAGFIGSPAMNFLPGRLEGDNDQAAVRRRADPGQIESKLQGRRQRARRDRGHPPRALRGRRGRAGERHGPAAGSRPRSTSSSRWAPSCTPTSTSRRQDVHSDQLTELAADVGMEDLPSHGDAPAGRRAPGRRQQRERRARRSSSCSTRPRSSCSTPTGAAA